MQFEISPSPFILLLSLSHPKMPLPKGARVRTMHVKRTKCVRLECVGKRCRTSHSFKCKPKSNWRKHKKRR